MVKMLERVWGN